MNNKLSITFFSIVFSVISVFANTEKTYLVSDFGAVGDGKTLNTEKIQQAIDAANAANGGTVVFPKGRFLSGSIVLKSNVTLQLNKGAVLLGSIDPRHYVKYEHDDAPVSPKTDDNSKLALILAYKANNISIVGTGTIDGQGRELALFGDSLHHKGIRVDPKYWGRMGETFRPKLINFMLCNNVKVLDITIQNSACWVQTYEICSNVLLDNLTVISRAYWNNDGMDITDCKNVRVTNCYLDTADDAICLKSYYTGYYNDSIYIANCEIRSSASAIKFGTASVGGFKNVTIENIKVFDTYRSAITIQSVDGGFVDNVSVNNIVAKNTGNAIFVRLGSRWGKPGYIKNLSFKNISVEVPFGRPDEDYDMRGPALNFFHNQFPAPIVGMPGYPIQNVSLENIKISYPGRASKGMAYIPLWRMEQVPERIKDYPEYTMFGELPSWGFYLRHVENISMKNIILKLRDHDFRPAIAGEDVKGFVHSDILFPKKMENQIFIK